MTDFISDGQPFETPISAATEGYAKTPPTFGRSFGALFSESSPTLMLQRASERGQYQGASNWDRGLYELGTANAGLPLDAPIETPVLSAKDANARYAPDGTKITDQPIPEGIAQLVGKARSDELDRESVLARFSAAHSLPYRFAIGTAAFALDPLNAASIFVPGVGEEAVGTGLARIGLGSGFAARSLARITAGGASGALAQAPLSLGRYALGTEEASDYSLRDAFRDMAFTGAGAAVLHAGFGAFGDLAGRRVAGASAITAETPDQTLALVRGLERSADNAVSTPAFAGSRGGAIGRYQIMPSTAREYGFDPARLKDPAYNETVARAVLADLSKRYPGDVEAQLVAYNAGTGRANAWLRAGRDNSVLLPETQAYLAHAGRIADIKPISAIAPDAITKADAMRAAVSQLADGRPVDVTPVVGESAALRAERETPATDSGTSPAGEKSPGVPVRPGEETPPVSPAAELSPERLGPAHPQDQAFADHGPLFSAATVADAQRRLYADGFAPGVPQPEFDAMRAEIYGKNAEAGADQAKGAAPQTVPEPVKPEQGTKAEPGVEQAKTGKAETVAPVQPNSELARMERRLVATPPESAGRILPDERAELQTTAGVLSAADLRDQAYQQAAQCLTEAGV